MEEDSTPRRPYQPGRSEASRNWRVADSTPRQDAKPRIQRSGEQRGGAYSPNSSAEAAAGTRLYVGNLLYTAQPKDVEQIFVDNGFAISNIIMSTDPFTGRNPSYCFVDLETPEEASKAMSQLNGADVLGRPVKINPGVAKKAGEGAQSRVRNYEGGWNRNERGSPNPNNQKPSFDRWSRNDASDHWQGTQAQGKRLYVGGLPRIEPQATVDSEMQKLFEGFELQAVSKIISPHPSKAEEPGNHYYLFVDLRTAEDAAAAIERLSGSESPWGGELKVNRAKDNRDRKVVREQFGGSEPRVSGASPWRRETREG